LVPLKDGHLVQSGVVDRGGVVGALHDGKVADFEPVTPASRTLLPIGIPTKPMIFEQL
jgi:hypothetical protein